MKALSNTPTEPYSKSDMLPSGIVSKNTPFCPGCNYARSMEAELRQLKLHYDALRQKALRLSMRSHPEIDDPLSAEIALDFAI